MKKIYQSILTILVVCMAVSCSDDSYDSPSSGGGGSGEEVTVSLTAIIPSMSISGTRTVSESDIESIDALVFDNAGLYLYRASVSNQDFAASPITFDIKLVATTAGIKVHYFANANAQIEAAIGGFTAGATTEDDVRQAIYATDVDGSGITSSKMMMWGLGEYGTVESGLIDSNSTTTVNLLRSTARIDVGLDYDGYGSWLGLSNFELAGVYVYNVTKGGYAGPELSNFTNTGNDYKVTAPTSYDSSNLLERYDMVEATGNAVEEQIYVYERATGDPELCLIIAGYYNGSKTLCYYRTDLKDGGAYVNMLRNHRYRLNIEKIEGQGFYTIDEALTTSVSGMTTTLVITDENIANVAYAGNQFLSTNYKLMEFYRNGATYKLIIETSIDIQSNPDDLSVGKTDDSDAWFSIENKSSVTSTTTINGTTTYTITMDVRCDEFLSTGTEHRTGGILVKADNLYLVIDIDQSPMPDIEWEITPVKIYFYANGNPQYGSPAFSDTDLFNYIPLTITAPNVSDPENVTITFDVATPANVADQYWPLGVDTVLVAINDANGKTLQYIQDEYPNGIPVGVDAYVRTSTVTETINVTFSYTYNIGTANEGLFTETRQISISQLPADGTFSAIADTSYPAEGNLAAIASDYSDYYTFTITSEYDWEVEIGDDPDAEFATEDADGYDTYKMFVPNSIYYNPDHGSKTTVYFKLYENNSYNSRTGSIIITPKNVKGVNPITLYIVQDGYPPYITMFYEPTNGSDSYVETTAIDFTPSPFSNLNQYFGSNALWEWPSYRDDGNDPDAAYLWYKAMVKTNAYKWRWENSDDDTYDVILDTGFSAVSLAEGDYYEDSTIEPRYTWEMYFDVKDGATDTDTLHHRPYFKGNYDKSPAALTHTNTLTFKTAVDEVVNNATTNVVLSRTVPVRWNWGNELLSNKTYKNIYGFDQTNASSRTHWYDGFRLQRDTRNIYPDSYNNGVSLTDWVANDVNIPCKGWYFVLTLYTNTHFVSRVYQQVDLNTNPISLSSPIFSTYEARTYGAKGRSHFVPMNASWASRTVAICAALSNTNTSSYTNESPAKAYFTQLGYDFEIISVTNSSGYVQFDYSTTQGFPNMTIADGIGNTYLLSGTSAYVYDTEKAGTVTTTIPYSSGTTLKAYDASEYNSSGTSATPRGSIIMP